MNNRIIIFLVTLSVTLAIGLSALQPTFDMTTRFDQGKSKYQELQSQVSSYGTCWVDALEALHTGCRKLNEESQGRLALAFTNCFLEKTGHPTYECPVSVTFDSCLKSLSDRAFNAYNNFFTHTQSICFYLASELWQVKTESTINYLTKASSEVASSLDEIHQIQASTLKLQNQLQQRISTSNTALKSLESTLVARNSIEGEILRGFREIQQLILGELNRFYSLFFYLVSIALTYFITTPNRTAGARFAIYVLLALNLAIERYMIHTTVTYLPFGTSTIHSASLDIDCNVWLCRKTFIVLSIFTLLYYSITFRDYDAINHQLLQVHSKELETIKMHLLSLSQNRMDAICKQWQTSDDLKQMHLLSLAQLSHSSPLQGSPTKAGGQMVPSPSLQATSLDTVDTITHSTSTVANGYKSWLNLAAESSDGTTFDSDFASDDDDDDVQDGDDVTQEELNFLRTDAETLNKSKSSHNNNRHPPFCHQETFTNGLRAATLANQRQEVSSTSDSELDTEIEPSKSKKCISNVASVVTAAIGVVAPMAAKYNLRPRKSDQLSPMKLKSSKKECKTPASSTPRTLGVFSSDDE